MLNNIEKKPTEIVGFFDIRRIDLISSYHFLYISY